VHTLYKNNIILEENFMKIKRLRKIVAAVLLSAFMLGTLGATAAPDDGYTFTRDEVERIGFGECPRCIVGDCSRCVRVEPDDCEWLEAVGRLTRDEIDGIINGESFPCDFPLPPPSYNRIAGFGIAEVNYFIYDSNGEYVESGVMSYNIGETMQTSGISPVLPIAVPPLHSVRFVPQNDERGLAVPDRWHFGFAYGFKGTQTTTMLPTVTRNTTHIPGTVVPANFVPQNVNFHAYAVRAPQSGHYSATLYNSGSTVTIIRFEMIAESTDAGILAWLRARR
jgi:hypothetical protein